MFEGLLLWGYGFPGSGCLGSGKLSVWGRDGWAPSRLCNCLSVVLPVVCCLHPACSNAGLGLMRLHSIRIDRIFLTIRFFSCPVYSIHPLGCPTSACAAIRGRSVRDRNGPFPLPVPAAHPSPRRRARPRSVFSDHVFLPRVDRKRGVLPSRGFALFPGDHLAQEFHSAGRDPIYYSAIILYHLKLSCPICPNFSRFFRCTAALILVPGGAAGHEQRRNPTTSAGAGAALRGSAALVPWRQGSAEKFALPFFAGICYAIA